MSLTTKQKNIIRAAKAYVMYATEIEDNVRTGIVSSPALKGAEQSARNWLLNAVNAGSLEDEEG